MKRKKLKLDYSDEFEDFEDDDSDLENEVCKPDGEFFVSVIAGSFSTGRGQDITSSMRTLKDFVSVLSSCVKEGEADDS